jgi:hypothetical protein
VNETIPPPDVKCKPIWHGRDLLLIIIGVGIIFFIGIVFVVYRYTNYQPGTELSLQPTIETSIILGLLECAALLGGVFLMGIWRRKLSWQAVGIKSISGRWLWWSIILGLLVIPISGLIALLVQMILGSPLENPQLEFIAPEGFSWLGLMGMLLVGGILAPFAEEVFFRGVLFEWIQFRWGLWIGILASSAIFGIMHGDISVAVAAFGLGIILAWSYHRSQSLWSAVIIHVINNSAKILALYILIALGIPVS